MKALEVGERVRLDSRGMTTRVKRELKRYIGREGKVMRKRPHLQHPIGVVFEGEEWCVWVGEQAVTRVSD